MTDDLASAGVQWQGPSVAPPPPRAGAPSSPPAGGNGSGSSAGAAPPRRQGGAGWQSGQSARPAFDWGRFYQQRSLVFQSPERRHLYGSQLLCSPYRRLFQSVRTVGSSEPFHQFVCHVGVGDLRSHRYSIMISDPPGQLDTQFPEAAFQIALSYPFITIPDAYFLLQFFTAKHSDQPPYRDVFRLRFALPFPSSSSASASSSSSHAAAAAARGWLSTQAAKLLSGWNPPTISGAVAMGQQQRSSGHVHVHQPLYWGQVAAGVQLAADVTTVGSTASVRYFGGVSVSYPLADERNTRLVVAVESGDQQLSNTSDLLELHSFSELHADAAKEKTTTITAAVTNSEMANNLVTPAWNVLGSARIVPGLSCYSVAAYFQFFRAHCKADCGAVFSYFTNSQSTPPQGVLTAGARWHFQHPALSNMESSLSFKLSTGFQDPYRAGAQALHPANAAFSLDLTTPSSSIGRSSLAFSFRYQGGAVPFKAGVRLEHELVFA